MKAQRKDGPGRTSRQRRLMWLAVCGALVVAAFLVAVSVAFRPAGLHAGNITGAEEASALVAGLEENSLTLGDPAASVTVTEFLDVACPACAAASKSVVTDLISGPVRDGEVLLRMNPLAFLHPQSSERGALGLHAAGHQGKAWPLARVILENQRSGREDWLTEDALEAMVGALGMDVAAWREHFAGDAVVVEFTAARDNAARLGVESTPTFIVEGPGGTETVRGAVTIDVLKAAIAQVSTD